MQDEDKSKAELISELSDLRQKVDELKVLNDTYMELENALQETERYYNNFLDLIPVAIFTKNVEGRYTQANADTLTYWSNSPVGFTDAELLPEDIANKLRAVDLQVMKTGKEHYGEEHLLVDGVLRTLLSRKVPLRSTDGTIMGILGISLNITEQKEAEEQGLQLKNERERTKLLSDFITQVSHEFRTPLTIVKSSTYLLGKISEPEKQLKHLNKIDEQADNIETLIENMITLSVFDSHQTLKSGRVELNQLLKSLSKTKQSEHLDKGINYILELGAPPLWVKGEEAYFEQAIQYIWDNAIGHTPNGGNITIRAHAPKQSVIIDIIDTGRGIADRDLPYIFDRFYRADKVGQTRGFGLGLPIARAIVESFGGSVTVESSSEKGSHFRISLPLG